jgi:tetraacyldisaccharide-1-P 4'-kinase
MVIERMIFEAMQLGVPLVTTEKDMVRIDSIYYQYIIPILLQLNIPQHEENRLIDFLEQKLFS